MAGGRLDPRSGFRVRHRRTAALRQPTAPDGRSRLRCPALCVLQESRQCRRPRFGGVPGPAALRPRFSARVAGYRRIAGGRGLCPVGARGAPHPGTWRADWATPVTDMERGPGGRAVPGGPATQRRSAATAVQPAGDRRTGLHGMADGGEFLLESDSHRRFFSARVLDDRGGAFSQFFSTAGGDSPGGEQAADFKTCIFAAAQGHGAPQQPP